MRIEDLLSRYSSFIQNNEDRIPEFESSEAAEKKLRKLYQKLQTIKAENKRVSDRRRNIEQRMTELNNREDELAEANEANEEMAKDNEQSRKKQAAEYDDVLDGIERAKLQLEKMRRTATDLQSATDEAQKCVDKAANEFMETATRLALLKKEEKRLLTLEKQSRKEIMSCEQDRISCDCEEDSVIETERELKANEAKLAKYRETLRLKEELIQEKRRKLAQMMADSGAIGDEMEGVKQFQATPHSMKGRTLTAQFDGSGLTREMFSDDSEDEIPLKMSNASPLSISAQKPRMSASDISNEAIEAIQMELVDTKSLKARIEAQISGWRRADLFNSN